jgi:hypothetical protein
MSKKPNVGPDDLGTPIVECTVSGGLWLVMAGMTFVCVPFSLILLVACLAGLTADRGRDLLLQLALVLMFIVSASATAALIYHYNYFRRKRIQLFKTGVRTLKPPGLYQAGDDIAEFYAMDGLECVAAAIDRLGVPHLLLVNLKMKDGRELTISSENFFPREIQVILASCMIALYRRDAAANTQKNDEVPSIAHSALTYSISGLQWEASRFGNGGAVDWKDVTCLAIDTGGNIRLRVSDIYLQTGVPIAEFPDFGKLACIAEEITGASLEAPSLDPWLLAPGSGNTIKM